MTDFTGKSQKCTKGLKTNTKNTLSILKEHLEDLKLQQNYETIKHSPFLQTTEIHDIIKLINDKEYFLNSQTLKKIELNRAEQYEEMTEYFFKYLTPKRYRTVMTRFQY